LRYCSFDLSEIKTLALTTSHVCWNQCHQLFAAVGIANLTSKNQLRMNFPAIDSADDGKDGGIALQVTSVANAKKINETITTFEKKDTAGKSLQDDYASLYIFGFCKLSKNTDVPDYCHLVDTAYLVNKLIDLDDEERVQSVIDSVRRHTDYSSLHPHDDITCLKIVLGYVGRNAIRHHMNCEGSLESMTKGLKEVSELIGKGTVNGKHKSKAQHDFDDPDISTFLLQVLNWIGAIMAIVQRKNRNGFVGINHDDMMRIDRMKQSISMEAKRIAGVYNIPILLDMHDPN
jgi:hypothetical protein